MWIALSLVWSTQGIAAPAGLWIRHRVAAGALPWGLAVPWMPKSESAAPGAGWGAPGARPGFSSRFGNLSY